MVNTNGTAVTVIGIDIERGIAVRQGRLSLRLALPQILAAQPDVVSPRMLHIIEDLAGDWRRLAERIQALSDEIEAIARQDIGCERLMSVTGVGPIISSAMVAAIGTGDAFRRPFIRVGISWDTSLLRYRGLLHRF